MLNSITTNIDDSDFKSIAKLLKAMCYDPVISSKVINILNMDSFHRRFVLNNWLEHLQRNNAPKELTQTLSYLFDDLIAEKVYSLINRSGN